MLRRSCVNAPFKGEIRQKFQKISTFLLSADSTRAGTPSLVIINSEVLLEGPALASNNTSKDSAKN